MEYIDEDDLDYKTSPMCDPDYAAKGRIRIISRGQMYEVERATLLRYPETKLNEIIRRSQTSKTEFYFNRDPEIINCILNFYATGELHFRHSMCKDEVLAEIKYWKIDETKLAPCCWVNTPPQSLYFISLSVLFVPVNSRCGSVRSITLMKNEKLYVETLCWMSQVRMKVKMKIVGRGCSPILNFSATNSTCC